MLLITLMALGAEHVDLRFGWWPGMTCTETSELKTVVGDGSPLVVRTATRITTVRDSDGLRITEVPLHVEAQSPRGGEARYHALFAGLIAERPDFVVDSEGNLLRVEGAASAEAAARSQVATLTSQLGDGVPSAVAELAEQVAFLEDLVRREWGARVGDWQGQRLVFGESTSFLTSLGSPALGRAQVRVPTRVRAEGRVPCEADRADAGCVYLTWAREADGRTLVDAARTHAQALNPEARVSVRRAAVQETGHVVMDPRTLQVYERRVDLYEDVRVVVDGVAVSSAPRTATEVTSSRCSIDWQSRLDAVAMW